MVDNNLKNNVTSFVNLKDNELIKAYVKDIMKYKPLSSNDEKVLFEKVERGKSSAEILSKMSDKDSKDAVELKKLIKEGDSARDEILTRNQRFVYATAKRYSQEDNFLPDLISEGNLGLITAFDTYDYKSGNRFCTYAIWYIRRSINAYITAGSEMIYKSNNSKTNGKIDKIKDKFSKSNGRTPSNDEIIDILSEEYGISIKNESDLYDLRIVSIDTGYDDEDTHAFENSAEFVSHTSTSGDEVENSDENFNEVAVSYLMKFLDSREKEIISMAFGINDDSRDYSNSEIAEKFGVTAERIRQIKNGALKKMREHAQEVKSF